MGTWGGHMAQRERPVDGSRQRRREPRNLGKSICRLVLVFTRSCETKKARSRGREPEEHPTKATAAASVNEEKGGTTRFVARRGCRGKIKHAAAAHVVE